MNECWGEVCILLSGLKFEHLKKNESYKYVGINVAGRIEHNAIREQVKREYFSAINASQMHTLTPGIPLKL